MISTGKSGSSWLDRLRIAKGFPEIGSTDLENFLQNPSSTNSDVSDPSPTPDPIIDPKKNEDKKLFNIMSSVLNELFNFGDNCDNSTKLEKSARKQANPKICAFSNNCTDENNNAASEKAAASRNNGGVERVKELDIREYEREREERDGGLSGFSRMEVTVIDTSYETWKFDKLLYRKKNVWKVRDKKGKSDSVGNKKKRKVNGGAEEDRSEGKKRKVDEKEGCELPLNEVYHQTNKSEAQGKILRKKQRDLKLENGSSSIVLIKRIPTSKKNGTKISKSCLKLK